MANKNLTIFQKLSKIVGPTGMKTVQTEPQTNRYSLNNNELLKTTDKAEFELAKKQEQQNKYLGKLWQKVEGELFKNSINYETTRFASYSDFEQMEYYPEIATALDIISQEATTIGNNGRIMNIYSDSKRVKKILEDLFFNRLDLHTSLPMWTRNTAKYGDNFVFLNTDAKLGIVGARQLPNIEIERRENELYNMIKTDNMKNNVKFIWKGRNIEFDLWQIAHFRILGDDRRLPYGVSMLEKSRRIWRRLVLAEDAMLTYRVQRAAERRVFKIYVGNIDDNDVGAYVNEIANRFKRKPSVDPQTGQVDLRYQQLSNDEDFFIPVRSEDAPNPIDVLPGASNLDQIADLQYLHSKLCVALRVPKPFLGFEESNGDGKNLALQDIRFSRMVNGIQQTMLQELNKIAIIQLIMLGFDDEIDNFTLTLNNPSTQAEMLKIEHLQQKITLYKDSVADAGNGFGAMSMTKAKRDILGWNDDEIKQDLLEQRMEKAASAELANTNNIIKHTGMFDVVDKIYGDFEKALEGSGGGESDEKNKGGGSGGGGGFGGGGIGADDLDFGDESETPEGEEGAAEGETPTETETPEGAPSEETTPTTAEKPTAESIEKVTNLLTEQKNKLRKQLDNRTKKYEEMYVEKLIESFQKNDKKITESIKIDNKNVKINKDINDMIDDIDEMLGDNKQNKTNLND